jgi:putative ABC transport system ATP-binding protein
VRLVQRLVGASTRRSLSPLLDEVGLRGRENARPAALSGGEAARAGLAVALPNRPVVVLADEPTGELDEASADRIMELLRRRADDGAAVLVVTHNVRIAGLADREVKLLDGRIVP